MDRHTATAETTDLGISGLVFNIMRFSLHDGPGIRTTVFLKGCPLNCWWCHNPESQTMQPQVLYSAERCIRCEDCIPACPEHALTWADGPIRDAAICRDCGTCVEACIPGARQQLGRRMSVAALMKVVRRDVVFYEESGGGVTFSGGEPMLQPDFLEAALVACGEEGIHRAVDTCGSVSKEILQRLRPKVDLFLYDLKLMDNARHQKFAGAGNRLILENLAMLSREKAPLRVRIPIVPGINDDDGNLVETAGFLEHIGINRVDLLPFHQIGEEKYNRLESRYRLASTAPPSAERMEEIAGRFRREGFVVRIGG